MGYLAKLQIPLHFIFPDLSMQLLLPFLLMMRNSVFLWSTVHVKNAYVDNVCISEDYNNSPRENVPPPLPFSYPKIYPIIVPGIISYSNTSHFIIVFFGAVHV